MGFWSRLLGFDTTDPAQRVLPEPYESFNGTAGIPVMDPGTPVEFWVGGSGTASERAEVDRLWQSQPNLRKVVDFIARNVASVPFHVYDRVSDTDRRRVRDHDLSRALTSPRQGVGQYRFLHSLVSDALLYDRFVVVRGTDENGQTRLTQIPAWRTRFDVDALRRVKGISFYAGEGQRNPWEPIDLSQAIFDYGYAPAVAGLSPVVTLRDILDESREAVRYRRDVWENGARMPGYVYRPPGAPRWEEAHRSRFVEGMRSHYGKGGANAGGMPLFEDGMEIRKADIFSPQDAADLEGRRLTAIEVASAYHIAPELVGAQQGNYSNVREFRQMLYRDSLGPYIRALEDVFNAQLVPALADGRSLYVEANVEAKLRGSFEEQAQIMQSAVGAPWTTRNEARARMNMSPLPGGDEIVTPLNVLVGGQASPTDSGSQNQNAAPSADDRHKAFVEAIEDTPRRIAEAALRRVKARAPETFEEKHEQVLAAFFERQGRTVRTALGVKADGDWWDAERWDAELAGDLLALSAATAEQVGRATAERLGYDPDRYDHDRTLAFLKAVAEREAAAINATTKASIDAALAEGDPDAVADVFKVAAGARASQAAVTLVTQTSGFGATEAGRQLGGGAATKTWIVTSSNPRASHAAMNGQTVGIDDVFSNGLAYPAVGGDPDEVANCRCEVEITIP